MTRLLAPEMFGVMAVVVLIMMGVTLLTDIGLATNVIQSSETDDPDFMDTIWSVQIVKGFFIWILMLVFSIVLYLLVKYHVIPSNTSYANPTLPFLIPVLGFSLVISGFEPTWIMLATKQFKQKLITKIDLASQVVSIGVMVFWARLDPSVWALVAGSLAYTVSRIAMAYYFNIGRLNKWHWDFQHAHKIIHFGKWIIFSTIIGYVVNNGDRVMLGGMVTEHLMGLHSIAYFFILAVMAVYGKFLSNVTYPALCEVKNSDENRLEKTYYKFRYISDFGLLLFAGVLWESAESIVKFLYDSRYHQAGSILKVMSISLIAARYHISDQLFLSLGKPKLMTMNILVKLIALLILFPWAFHLFGFNGALWASVIASFSSIPVILFYMAKLNVFSLKKEVMMLPVFLVGMVAGKLIAYTLSLF